MIKFKNYSNLLALLLAFNCLVSCSSSDDTNEDGDTGSSSIDINEALLSDFPLFGITPVSIDITNPSIEDNKETSHGKVVITVSHSTVGLDKISASITSDELNLSKFEITPSNSEQLSFEDGKTHTFTISSVETKEELLHYDVQVLQEEAPVDRTPRITRFSFEKSKNPALTEDIDIHHSVQEFGLNKIYIFVPVGTDFTDLTPTVTFEGSKLYYNQESSSTDRTEYTDQSMSFDLKYPKTLSLIVEDDEGELKTTSIIVDVINPVKLGSSSVSTPNAVELEAHYFSDVTTWTNQGNHPISFYKATKYENSTSSPTFADITASRVVPGGGLKPGESASINVTISRYFPAGSYETTAIFYTKIFNDHDSNDLFEEAKLTISAEIVATR
ncbi:hypothetical protein [Reichenbachiella versicolor]|uniref:hypothetical protein n=1 Tax=Reichenbachiella versicolor TaxID=1821036 RepID=UPI000D6E889A|nr:hypothetical protein [Reichenbachiella versicolor]